MAVARGVDVRPDFQPHALTGHNGEFERCRRVLREPSEQEARKAKAYERLLDWMQNRMNAIEAGEAEDIEGLENAHYDREQEADELRDSMRVPSPHDAAMTGAVIYLDRSGRPRVLSGLIRPEDRTTASTDAADDDASAGRSGGLARAAETPRNEYAERLMRQLTTHRTAALQACLIDSPAVALRVLAYQMAALIFLSHGFYMAGDQPVAVRLTVTGLDKRAPDYAESQACVQIARTLDE